MTGMPIYSNIVAVSTSNQPWDSNVLWGYSHIRRMAFELSAEIGPRNEVKKGDNGRLSRYYNPMSPAVRPLSPINAVFWGRWAFPDSYRTNQNFDTYNE
jgi:hypothetical protein